MNEKEYSSTASKAFKMLLMKLKIKNAQSNDNDLFTLWISDNNELPELQHLSLKSMLLTGHNVTLYTYSKLNNVPDGIKTADANKVLDKSKIFKYKTGFNSGSYSGFANWFRTKCMYETGKAWFECDILAISNITGFNFDSNVISSQYDREGNISPNNAFLKLKKKDKLLKTMLNYMESVKDNVKHGDTGPRLLKSLIDDQYNEYSSYLTKPDFIASINFFDYKDFLKPSKDIIKGLEFDEIWGFHMWNAMFREYGMEHEGITSGFYYDLKEAILTSSTKAEYKEKIETIIKASG